jgi:hypothetical protein
MHILQANANVGGGGELVHGRPPGVHSKLDVVRNGHGGTVAVASPTYDVGADTGGASPHPRGSSSVAHPLHHRRRLLPC